MSGIPIAGLIALLLCVGPPAPVLKLGGAEPPPRRFEFRATHMGTEFRLILYTSEESVATSASTAVFERVAELDRILSDYDPDSELMRLCDRAGGPPVSVSADLFRVLVQAERLARASEGAFDPTVNPVVRLWRRARRERKLPAAEALARARSLVGYHDLVLDPTTQSVTLRRPGMKLDLGGIAKGYASQEALAVLGRQGIRRALVAAAGDITVADPPPDQEGWRVAVAPLEPGAPAPVLLLSHQAISTSGDAERFVEIEGKRYSHIVDPRTGLGVIDRASVTVVADDAPTADGLATAVYVLGPERGLALVEATPGASAFIVRKRIDGLEIRESRRWKQLRQIGEAQT